MADRADTHDPVPGFEVTPGIPGVATRSPSLIPSRSSRCAARIIQNKALHNAAYELTGGEAPSFPDVAEALSKGLGRKISYVALDEATLRSNVTSRVPAWLADIVVGIELAIEAGL
jgi:uncharacterized protein YbjT (DUF2867 family)